MKNGLIGSEETTITCAHTIDPVWRHGGRTRDIYYQGRHSDSLKRQPSSTDFDVTHWAKNSQKTGSLEAYREPWKKASALTNHKGEFALKREMFHFDDGK